MYIMTQGSFCQLNQLRYLYYDHYIFNGNKVIHIRTRFIKLSWYLIDVVQTIGEGNSKEQTTHFKTTEIKRRYSILCTQRQKIGRPSNLKVFRGKKKH
jgi:hypothetical protein